MSISTRTPPPVASRWAEAQSSKEQRQKRNRRRLFWSMVSVVAVAAMCVAVWELAGVYKAHKHAQFVNSIKDDPKAIHDAADAGKISRDEESALFHDTREEHMNKRMDEYFALPPDQRLGWMENFLKEMQENRQRWQANGGPTSRPAGNGNWNRGNGNNNPQNQANNAANRTAHYESRDPNRTAQFQQFHADMAAAMKQMGMEPPQGHGHGH